MSSDLIQIMCNTGVYNNRFFPWNISVGSYFNKNTVFLRFSQRYGRWLFEIGYANTHIANVW